LACPSHSLDPKRYFRAFASLSFWDVGFPSELNRFPDHEVVSNRLSKGWEIEPVAEARPKLLKTADLFKVY